MLACAVSASAQQPPSDEEVVRLSPFAVQENADMGRYQAAQVSSGSRVSMDLMDSTQSISVVTNEFMQDVGTGRVADVVKYVAGVQTNSDLKTFDSMSIRGYASFGTTLDGFYQFNWSNQDPIIIERIEVVKGPNAILAPLGNTGGVVNNVTKKPLFTNKGYVSYQVGRYDSNRTELDVNYVVRPDKLAIRVVGAVTDADDYGKGDFHQDVTVSPMFTYRFSPTTELTYQFQAHTGNVLSPVALPVSIYAVGRSNVRPVEGMPRDFRAAGRNMTYHQSGKNHRFSLTSQITDKLSVRLAGSWSDVRVRVVNAGLNNATPEVVTLDPITGEWSWDGITKNDNPRYTLGAEKVWSNRTRGNLQNDLVYEVAGASWKSKTIGGWAISYNGDDWRPVGFVPDSIEYDLSVPYTPPPTYTLQPDFYFHSSGWGRTNQVYLYEVVNLLDERLALSGGLSQNRYFGGNVDNFTLYRNTDKGEALLPSGGVVYKITPDVSVYYGFTKQELLVGGNEFGGIPPHTIPTRQHEGGVRLRLFDGKLYATLAYFDLLQSRIYESASTNSVIPPPMPPDPPVLTSINIKGTEFELTWSPTKNFSIIGSYTDFDRTDSDGNVTLRTQIASAWGSYTFDTGPFRGLRVGIGAVYTGEAPNIVGRYTQPPAGQTPVRTKPMFWVPSYTLVEASASYRFNKHWQAQLVVKNLFDKDAVIGAVNRTITVNTPINPKLSLRYEF